MNDVNKSAIDSNNVAGNLNVHFTQLGDDLIHPIFHDSPLAKRSLSFQLFRAGINAAAWKARNDQGEAFFAARRSAAGELEQSEGGWMNQASESSVLTAPKYDRDDRDGGAIALALISLALDYEFVPSSPTYMQEAIMNACKRLCNGVTNRGDAESLAALTAATDDAGVKKVIAETFVSYKTDWLNQAEMERAVIGMIDCPPSELAKVSPGDILTIKDVIRPMVWALGDPGATVNQYGAFYDAIKAKEAGQVKLILEAHEELSAIEAQVFPINEED